jgi:hypothetical protein
MNFGRLPLRYNVSQRPYVYHDGSRSRGRKDEAAGRENTRWDGDLRVRCSAHAAGPGGCGEGPSIRSASPQRYDIEGSACRRQRQGQGRPARSRSAAGAIRRNMNKRVMDRMVSSFRYGKLPKKTDHKNDGLSYCFFSSSLAMDSRWTSSGPSAKRRVREFAQAAAHSKSCEIPPPPWA